MISYRIDPDFYGDAFAVIEGSEGFEPNIYPDSVGVPTVGYGYGMLVKEPDGTYSINRGSRQNIHK